MGASGSKRTADGRPWRPDAEATRCSFCSTRFTLRLRRHHCRVCGDIFCKTCTTRVASAPGAAALVCSNCASSRAERVKSHHFVEDDLHHHGAAAPRSPPRSPFQSAASLTQQAAAMGLAAPTADPMASSETSAPLQLINLTHFEMPLPADVPTEPWDWRDARAGEPASPLREIPAATTTTASAAYDAVMVPVAPVPIWAVQQRLHIHTDFAILCGTALQPPMQTVVVT
jgi:hypothetical protein